MKQVGIDFFHRDALEVAPDLLGKLIVRRFEDGSEAVLRINETEVYRGTEDTACHASKGRTRRTEILYREAGVIYVYLCYGVHYLMNVITGEKEEPQGVLFRSCEICNGPGKLTRALGVDKSFNGESFINNPRIAIFDDGAKPAVRTAPRVGISYADEKYRNIPWRFIAEYPSKK